jgi:hypothetical protein
MYVSYHYPFTIHEWKYGEIVYFYMDELCNNHIYAVDLRNIIDSFTAAELYQSNINDIILLAIENFHIT